MSIVKILEVGIGYIVTRLSMEKSFEPAAQTQLKEIHLLSNQATLFLINCLRFATSTL